MNRWLLSAICVAACMISTGCCGPMLAGPGCGTGCNDCEGALYGERIIHARPLDGLRHLRKQIACGAGCGGVYVDEWVSTPPDCTDPCCDDQWIGGATKCRPGCWQPGMLLSNLYGSRFCSDEESSMPCDCGEIECEGDCGLVETVSHSIGVQSDCDCGNHSPTPRAQARVRRTVPAADTMTRSKRPTLATAGRFPADKQ